MTPRIFIRMFKFKTKLCICQTDKPSFSCHSSKCTNLKPNCAPAKKSLVWLPNNMPLFGSITIALVWLPNDMPLFGYQIKCSRVWLSNNTLLFGCQTMHQAKCGSWVWSCRSQIVALLCSLLILLRGNQNNIINLRFIRWFPTNQVHTNNRLRS